MFCVYVFHKNKINLFHAEMSATRPNAPALSACAHLHITKNQFFGPNWKDKQNKSLIDWYFIKYANTEVLLICYSISKSTVQGQLIWESYSKADGYVRFMSGLKMVTSKIKSYLTHTKKQISTITKLAEGKS